MASKRGTFSFLLFVACVCSGYQMQIMPSSDLDKSDWSMQDKKVKLATFFDSLKSLAPIDPVSGVPTASVEEMMCNCTYLLDTIQQMRNSSVSTNEESVKSLSNTAEEMCEPGTKVPMLFPNSGKESDGKNMRSNNILTKREIRKRIMKKLGHIKCKSISHAELKDLQSVARGLPLCVLKRIKAKEILSDPETLRNITKCLRKGQMMALMQRLRANEDPTELVKKLPDDMLSILPEKTLEKVNFTILKTINLTRLQSLWFAKRLGKRLFKLKEQGSLLQGYSCEMIAESDPDDMMQVVSENPQLLSKVQAVCAAKKLLATMEEKSRNYFKNITPEKVDKIPPFLILFMPPSKLKNLPDSVCPNFLRKMEAANMNLLPPRCPSRAALTKKALDCLVKGGSLSALTPEDVSKLGKLVCELSASHLRNMTQDVAKSTLKLMAKCKHIPQKHRADLKQLVTETYGDPSDWTPETMKALGSLLDDNTLSSLPNKPWMKDVLHSVMSNMRQIPLFLKKKLFALTTTMPSYTACKMKAEYMSTYAKSGGSIEGEPTVRMINALEKNNVYWTVAQLESMSNETFVAAVEELGAVTDFNVDQVAVLSRKAVEAFGPVSQMTEDTVEQLGCINTGFSDAQLKSLPFSLDSIKDMVKCGWTGPKMVSVWKAVAKNDNLTAQQLGAPEIVTLNQLLCGLDSSEITQLNKEAFRDSVCLINDINCPPAVARQFKILLVSVFGTPDTWNEAQVCESGNIIGALDSSEWASLPPRLFPFLKDTSIQIIPPENFAKLSVDQLKALGSDNADAVTTEQQEALSNEQKAALEEALTGTARQASTPESSGAPSLSVEGTSAFMKPLLFFFMAVLLL